MNKAITENDIKLLGFLNAHLLLHHRVEVLISIIEDSDELFRHSAVDMPAVKDVGKRYRYSNLRFVLRVYGYITVTSYELPTLPGYNITFLSEV